MFSYKIVSTVGIMLRTLKALHRFPRTIRHKSDSISSSRCAATQRTLCPHNQSTIDRSGPLFKLIGCSLLATLTQKLSKPQDLAWQDLVTVATAPTANASAKAYGNVFIAVAGVLGRRKANLACSTRLMKFCQTQFISTKSASWTALAQVAMRPWVQTIRPGRDNGNRQCPMGRLDTRCWHSWYTVMGIVHQCL